MSETALAQVFCGAARCGERLARVVDRDGGLVIVIYSKLRYWRFRDGRVKRGPAGEPYELVREAEEIPLTPVGAVQWPPEHHVLELPCGRCGRRWTLQPDHPAFRADIRWQKRIVLRDSR